MFITNHTDNHECWTLGQKKKCVPKLQCTRLSLSLSANFHRTDSCTCVVNLWLRGTRCFQHHLCVWFLSVETHLECLSYLSDGPCPCVGLRLAKSRSVRLEDTTHVPVKVCLSHVLFRELGARAGTVCCACQIKGQFLTKKWMPKSWVDFRQNDPNQQ